MDNASRTLGDQIFAEIDYNTYLHELYVILLVNYGMRHFGHPQDTWRPLTSKERDAAMRFADLLSKSTHPERSDAHKNWAQELCVLATTLYPEDDMVRRYASATQINAGKQTLLWRWIHQNAKPLMTIYCATSATATVFYSRVESAEHTSTPEQALSASASKAHKTSGKPHKKHRARKLSTHRQLSDTRSSAATLTNSGRRRSLLERR